MSGISKGIITGQQGLISAAKRQDRFKQSMRDAGLKPLTVWVPADQLADLKEMCAAMRNDDDLAVGPCISKKTKRFRSWRNPEDQDEE